MAKDPLRFGGGTTSLYSYVGADPVNRFDPTGLWSLPDYINITVSVGPFLGWSGGIIIDRYGGIHISYPSAGPVPNGIGKSLFLATVGIMGGWLRRTPSGYDAEGGQCVANRVASQQDIQGAIGGMSISAGAGAGLGMNVVGAVDQTQMGPPVASQSPAIEVGAVIGASIGASVTTTTSTPWHIPIHW